MAAKQAHSTIVACSKRVDRETGVVAFQFVECCDQRLPISGQFERGGIRVQFAGARQCQPKQLSDRGSGAQQCGQRPTDSHASMLRPQ